MEVFCSWSGAQSKELAIAFENFVSLILDNIEVWISEQQLEGGDQWSAVILDKLKNSSHCIAFLTPENISSAWIYFESGAIAMRLGNNFVCPYLFNVSNSDLLKTPFSQIQSLKSDKDGTLRLIKKLYQQIDSQGTKISSVESRFDKFWNDLEREYERIARKYSNLKQFSARGAMLTSELLKLSSKLGSNNTFLNHIILNYIDDFTTTISKSSKQDNILEVSLPDGFYPFVLSDLLKKNKGTLTKAISIVDVDENFWPEKTGDMILACTIAKSIRIFAFTDARQLKMHLPMLLNHAKTYKVYVISSYNISTFFTGYPYDFSIIGDISTSSILAKYDNEHGTYKRITFTNESEALSKYNDLFSMITEQSFLITPDLASDTDFDNLVFHKMSYLSNRPVEMSAYIQIYDYDAHEEMHAYYLEMMDEMLQILKIEEKN